MNLASDIIEKHAIKTERKVLPPREKLFTRRRSFSDWARFVWPEKTAANLAAKAGTTERAAKYWLAGKEPSAQAVNAIYAQLAEDLK